MSAANPMMPNSDIIERMVLASLVLEQDSRQTSVDMLTPADFYMPLRAELFELLSALPRIDLTIARESLHGVNDKQRGIELRDELDACMRQREWLKDAYSTEDYCEELRDRRVCRELIDLGATLCVEGSRGIPNGAEFINDAEQKLSKVLSSRQDASQRPMSIGDVLRNVCIDQEAPGGSQSGELLSATGIEALDEIITGFRRGGYYVFAGPPGAGKSAIALQMAREIAAQHLTLVFSYEMTAAEVGVRMLSSATGIDSRAIERRALNKTQRAALQSAADALDMLQMPVMRPRSRTFEELRSLARAEYRKNGGKLGAIFVDYLQLLESKGRYQTKDQELGYISHGLKALALELDCALIAPAAVNRKADERQNKRPSLRDMRECGSIEYDANMIAGIYRPDADPTAACDDADKGTAEIIVMKQRGGPTGTIKLRFAANTTTFLPLHAARPQLYSV